MEHRAEHIAVDTAAGTEADHTEVDRMAEDIALPVEEDIAPAGEDIGLAVVEGADTAPAGVEQPAAAHSAECSEPADSG